MGESLINLTEGSGKKAHTWQRTVGANNVEDSVVIHGEQYLATYSIVTNAVSLSTANSHLLQIMAGSSLNVRVRRIELHQTAAATAAALNDFMVYRLTTAGSGGGSTTPSPLDTSDAACGATVQTLPSSKGTEGVLISRAQVYLVQTISASTPLVNPVYAWDFDRPRSKPLIIPAGTANGLAIKIGFSHAAGSVAIVAYFDESAWL